MKRALPAHADHPRAGLRLRARAYGLWGVLPIYFKAFAACPAVDIVAHRVLWSLPFLALLICRLARMAEGPRGTRTADEPSAFSPSRRC